VRTILALDDPLEVWQRLGHDYRVFVKITVFESPRALVVPLGALFRRGSDWCVFRVVDGRASIQVVRIGERNTSAAEVLDGLAADDPILLHPSDRVADGVRVRERVVEE
jgi:HlyD family secretion protein